jgi:hypothetical protein
MKQDLNILHSNTVVGESIWKKYCGLENDIKTATKIPPTIKAASREAG